MPNIKSAIKRVKIARERTLKNASARSALRTTLKRFEAALASADVDNARAALAKAVRALDKAAAKGLIHKNTASRKKSRITKRFNKAVV
ncbi:30S ribosomal protein s20 [Heliomicrobium modesticaldum Ice1]|uniref:Small ribosomal subunit protein bS20 n=1 Tax=Heliobacterium modesticaldum (strain ATCC 51547 / Ice1) TaxID=498761 RepID=RS20_HELMI|nr:30S ribosomal protein S20 [Heliomicrobium modesticaldum]B0TAC7.1 RecName: Full=Small ribosomal subunit protein bS20; AltName: Full=30S ribosomal protein S20 [Heliomicrobium modesticaldum Ice1]ABZ84977.1 30S ribosomal protein s20 [Heliomicrobium modesticaldum Ice1]